MMDMALEQHHEARTLDFFKQRSRKYVPAW